MKRLIPYIIRSAVHNALSRLGIYLADRFAGCEDCASFRRDRRYAKDGAK